MSELDEKKCIRCYSMNVNVNSAVHNYKFDRGKKDTHKKETEFMFSLFNNPIMAAALYYFF